jgi:hypothetical protein
MAPSLSRSAKSCNKIHILSHRNLYRSIARVKGSGSFNKHGVISGTYDLNQNIRIP